MQWKIIASSSAKLICKCRACGDLNGNDPTGSYDWIFGFQLVDCLRRIRKYGLVGGGVSLRVGFVVPEPITDLVKRLFGQYTQNSISRRLRINQIPRHAFEFSLEDIYNLMYNRQTFKVINSKGITMTPNQLQIELFHFWCIFPHIWYI